jgi:C-terminal processing protease CtpA/Prc
LFQYSKDRHLYVKYSPETVASLKNPAAEKEEDQNNLNYSTGKSRTNNYGFRESSVLEDNVGYLKIDAIDISHESLPALQAAMHRVEDTKALIIDLRDNGGGGSEIGSVLESYFLPAGMPLLEFRNSDGSLRTDSTVSWLNEKRYDKPVYIIVNKNTASAAEAFAFVLQQNKRATIVGDRSAGAAYMNEFFVVNDNNFVSVSTAAPSLPNKKISWEQKGVRPDIRIKNGDPVEQVLNKINK